jgi:hypothetical protein
LAVEISGSIPCLLGGGPKLAAFGRMTLAPLQKKGESGIFIKG